MVSNDWKTVHLKEILSTPVKNGFSPNAVDNQTGYVVLGLGALSDGKLNPNEIKHVEINDKIKQSQLRYGDFLISRSNTPDKVGRSVLFRDEIANCSYPDLMMKFRVNEELAYPNFIESALQSNNTRQYFKSCAAGSSSSMVKITKIVVEKTPIRLPPIQEQRKIAKILSTWDKAITITEKLIATNQQQKKALMQQLLTGKKRLVRSPEKKGETGMVFEGDWEEVILKDICSKVIDNRGKTPPLSDKGFPLVEINAIVNNKHPVLSKVTKFVSTETFNTWFRNGHPQKGDILVATVGSAGFCALVNQEEGFGSIAQNLIAIRLKTDINSSFLYYLMNTPDYFSKVKSVVMGAVQPSIKVPHLMAFKFLLPSITEQQKIASVLTAADKEIELLQAKLAHLKQEKKALMQQLLTGKKRVSLSS